MNITLIVGDFARVVEGKLDVLGAGWTVCGPGPLNMGIGILAEVAWAEMDETHHIEFVLLDDKGKVVPDEKGDPLFKVNADLTTRKPPGVLLGAPQVFPMAFNVNGVPVPPGKRYRLMVTHNGNPNIGWDWSFNSRPNDGPQQLAG